MEETTKLGRCECLQFHGKECHDGYRHCQRDAVRMVIVAGKVTDSDGITIAPVAYTEVPLCAACADFHEGKVAR